MPGRRTKNVEQLETLIAWAGGTNAFEVATGIRAADQRHYLAGTKNITSKRLERAAHQVFGTPPAFIPLAERVPLGATLPMYLAGKPGVYALFSSSGTLLYFGKATNLRVEMNQTLARRSPSRLVHGTTKTTQSFRSLSAYFSAYEVARGDGPFRHDIESLVLRVVRTDTLNSVGGHFQRKK